MNLRGKEKAVTFGKWVTAVAIAGAMIAVALPNYQNVERQVNRELAQQNLKVIITSMDTLLLLDSPHQLPRGRRTHGSSGGDLTITASLS